MLHLSASWLEAWLLSPAGRALRPVWHDRIWISQAPALYQHFCALNQLLFSDKSPAAKNAAIQAFLTDGLGGDHHRRTLPMQGEEYSARVSPALKVLGQANADAFSNAQLASLCGMSPYQFIRAFKACTGLTPHAWQLNRRVSLARGDLRSGLDIADTAHDHGFADQSHFHRTFKAHTAVTPGQYKTPH